MFLGKTASKLRRAGADHRADRRAGGRHAGVRASAAALGIDAALSVAKVAHAPTLPTPSIRHPEPLEAPRALGAARAHRPRVPRLLRGESGGVFVSAQRRLPELRRPESGRHAARRMRDRAAAIHRLERLSPRASRRKVDRTRRSPRSGSSRCARRSACGVFLRRSGRSSKSRCSASRSTSPARAPTCRTPRRSASQRHPRRIRPAAGCRTASRSRPPPCVTRTSRGTAAGCAIPPSPPSRDNGGWKIAGHGGQIEQTGLPALDVAGARAALPRAVAFREHRGIPPGWRRLGESDGRNQF